MRVRVDDNQAEIVKGLRAVPGVDVVSTANMRNGFPDLVVGYHGKNYLMQIKDGDKPPSRQRLTEHERRFHQTWRGQVAIVRNITEAYEVIGFSINN
jgi:hypothetical protein